MKRILLSTASNPEAVDMMVKTREWTREEYGWIARGRDFHDEPFHRQRVENTKKLISKFCQGGTILDVGWDSYPMAYDLAKSDYVGIDFLFHDRKNFPLVQAIMCNFDILPFQKKPIFDFILWCEGPEHSLDPYETLRGLREICKGKILLTCPPSSPVNWEHKTMIKDKNHLRRLIESQFTVLEIDDLPPFWIYGVGEVD